MQVIGRPFWPAFTKGEGNESNVLRQEMSDAEAKVLERAYQWEATRKARIGAEGQERARLDTAHWKAGKDLSEAVCKAESMAARQSIDPKQ